MPLCERMTQKLSQEVERMLPQEHVESRKEFQIQSERVDDIVLLIGVMVRMGLAQVLDHHIPEHWKQREFSWGWTVVIW